METNKIVNYANWIYIMCIVSLFIMGAISKYNLLITTIGIALSLCLIGVWLLSGVKVKIPKSILFYIIFIATLFIHQRMMGGQFSFVLLFIFPGFAWIIFYNLKEFAKMRKLFVIFLIIFTFIMTFMDLGARISGINSFDSNNLFLPLYEGGLHNHLGDIWAVTIVAMTGEIVLNKKTKYLPLILVGVVFVLSSFSRSAIISLALGLGYIYYTAGAGLKTRKIFITIIILLSAMFLYFGLQKTTIFARPYIREGVMSIINRPLGLGIGNFYKASKESSLAHNILLEVAAGIGVFSLTFFVWIGKFIRSFKTRETNPVFVATILAITSNFMFDTTYTIPAMMLFLFICFGLVFTEDLKEL